MRKKDTFLVTQSFRFRIRANAVGCTRLFFVSWLSVEENNNNNNNNKHQTSNYNQQPTISCLEEIARRLI
jgi:hypothetical protein